MIFYLILLFMIVYLIYLEVRPDEPKYFQMKCSKGCPRGEDADCLARHWSTRSGRLGKDDIFKCEKIQLQIKEMAESDITNKKK